MAINWLGLGLALLERLPLEKLIVKQEKRTTEIDVLEGLLAKQQAAVPQSAPAQGVQEIQQTPRILPESESPDSHSSAGSVRVTTDETIAYQRRELGKELLLLEKHLQQGCKIGGKACDCCEKHPIAIEGLALEAIGMSSDPGFREVLEFAQRIAPITTEEASRSGQWTEQYPQLALESREIRKRLTGSTQIRVLLDPALEKQVESSMAALMAKETPAETAKEENDGRTDDD